jgi:hypothetical protein
MNQYRRGDITKAASYMDIQAKCFEADGVSVENAEPSFTSFIKTIESHDTELSLAAGRGKDSGRKQRATSLGLDDRQEFEDEFDDDGNTVKNLKWTRPSSLGSKPKRPAIQPYQRVYPKPSNSCNSSVLTQNSQRDLSPTHRTVPNSQTLNGRMSSQGEQSTWTQSSAANSPHAIMTLKHRNSATSNSLMEQLNLPKRSQMEEIGPSHGTEQVE